MQIANTSTPVVVLKPDHHGALGIFRTLGRLGVKVYGVSSDPWSPGMTSRYCREKFVYKATGKLGSELVEFLQAAVRKIGGRAILTCANDVSRVFLAQYADRLKDDFIVPDMPLEMVQALSDKKQMYRLCKKHGVPTAETLFPQNREDILRWLENGQLRLPVMLKGIDGFLLERRRLPKMLIARTIEDLLQNYERMETPEAPNLMLQEYIPGGDDSIWMFNGYFNKNSECLIGIAGRKLRQYPVNTGSTSLGICLRNEAVESSTKKLMKAVSYRGVLDIGYRYDARDGQYKLLDVNPRIGATFRLFVAENGLDVVRAMYLDLTGQPVTSAPPLEGRKWMVENNDVISFRRYRAKGELRFADWLRSLRGVQEVAWFAWDDLLPFAIMAGRFFEQFVRWGANKLRLTRQKSGKDESNIRFIDAGRPASVVAPPESAAEEISH
jgi:predicted ATP-grasp superfamily ATP-dependent carboligase